MSLPLSVSSPSEQKDAAIAAISFPAFCTISEKLLKLEYDAVVSCSAMFSSIPSLGGIPAWCRPSACCCRRTTSQNIHGWPLLVREPSVTSVGKLCRILDFLLSSCCCRFRRGDACVHQSKATGRVEAVAVDWLVQQSARWLSWPSGALCDAVLDLMCRTPSILLPHGDAYGRCDRYSCMFDRRGGNPDPSFGRAKQGASSLLTWCLGCRCPIDLAR